MKTFDYEQVNAVLAPLKAKFDDCTHGEGNECETLDKHLECCASVCCEVVNAVREWANGVFMGEVIFDPAAESKWLSELAQIYSRAVQTWQLGRKAQVPCYDLPAQNKLASALFQLHWLLNDWVSPKLSAGPMARTKVKLSDQQRESIRKQLCALPPLE